MIMHERERWRRREQAYGRAKVLLEIHHDEGGLEGRHDQGGLTGSRERARWISWCLLFQMHLVPDVA